MTPRVLRAEVTAAPLDVAAMAAEVASAADGAVVTFTGVVRDHDDGRSVTRLDYEAHPAAGRFLRGILDELAGRPEGEAATALSVAHRTGSLGIGEVAFAVAVAAPHRRAAFGFAALVVDEVKARLPVWKRQHFADGTDEFVGSA